MSMPSQTSGFETALQAHRPVSKLFGKMGIGAPARAGVLAAPRSAKVRAVFAALRELAHYWGIGASPFRLGTQLGLEPDGTTARPGDVDSRERPWPDW